MKLQFFLIGCLIYSISGLESRCPDEFCATDIISTEPIIDSSTECPNLVAEKLATFTYNNNGVEDVLIELRGPSNLADAADLVIAAPHGGDLKPDYILDRATDGTYCPTSGCKTSKDSYTKEISELLQEKFISNYCKVPFLVINHLHRSKLDANREIGEAAQGHAIAEEAWTNFHTLINDAQLSLKDHFGTITVPTTSGSVSSRTGVKALLFDTHGYGSLQSYLRSSEIVSLLPRRS